MVFGIFTRKPTQDDASVSPGSKTNDQNARLPTPTPSIASVVHSSPLQFSAVIRSVLGGSTTDLTLKHSDITTDRVATGSNNIYSPAPPPQETPTTPSLGPDETEALYDLVLKIPPKTLHAYTLAHLRPQTPLPSASMSSLTPGPLPDSALRPPSPSTVAKLTTFFATLAPPPSLHCVRCHKDFFDIENEEKDKACRVPHDDESALVSRISGGGYETLWGCCGQTAPGDGSEGPPDGWCYEGRHTTDIRRARFRADSTIHHDKLTSCLKLNCHGIRNQLPRHDHTSPFRNLGTFSARKSNPSPVRSQASVLTSRSTRKRLRASLKDASGSENEADAESLTGRAATVKHKVGAGAGTGEGDRDTSMAVDEGDPPSKPRTMAKSRPISQARLPLSTSTTASLSTSGTNVPPSVPSKARTTTSKPKSTSSTLLSQSYTHPASDSEASTRSRPRTRSHAREESRARDASRSRPGSKLIKSELSERTRRARKVIQPPSRSPTSRQEPEGETDDHRESDREGRGRERKKRRVGRD